MLELQGPALFEIVTDVVSRSRLNKITSVNSNKLKSHKEKEMADFRKWLFAFAVVALMLGLQVNASAQSNAPAFACTANAGVPPIVRAEGVTELVGDLILNCTGGTPTAAGNLIPLSNVQIFLNTNITSRILNSSNLSEATMLIDEPYPSSGAVPSSVGPVSGAALTQLACAAVNSTNCQNLGVGPAPGGNPPIGANGPYSGVPVTIGASGDNPGITYNQNNVFQGTQNGVNSVAWLGVPIDAPGTVGFRIIRITNVRANACLLGVSSTFIPTQIVMFISVNGSQTVTINNPQQLVAYAQPGIVVSNGSASYPQCNNLNVDSSGNIIPGSGPVNVTATEGFASSFKVRSYGQVITPGVTDSTVSLQNIPGFSYNTESGFVASPTLGTGATGWGTSGGDVGLADTGTEISFSFAAIGAGVQLSVPNTVTLVQTGTTSPSGGIAILVGSSGGSGATTVGISGTAGSVTYEIVASNPNEIEDLVVPVTAGFVSNTGQNLPGIGVSTVQVNFAPLSSTPTASSSAPIPRFCQKYPAANIFTINTCSCNLLFPFVTNQAGFDTGIAIANTSEDTLNGVVPQQGTVALTYYGGTEGGGAAPAEQVSGVVTAGSELVFDLYGGGNLGIAATQGFQGYIIARANFQYCHGFAFISDLGAQKLAEGYLAIELDLHNGSGLNRTGVIGEVQGQ
jgi:hypothetical protein